MVPKPPSQAEPGRPDSKSDDPDAFVNAPTIIGDSPGTALQAEKTASEQSSTDSDEASTAILKTGSLLQGRYQIEKELGRGGIGAVYLAHDTKLHSRLVVIKVLLGDTAQEAWVYRKFLQEVEALTRIEHPNIVGVLDSGELANGKPFIVMQYVEGTTLRSQMKPEGMSLERVSDYIRQIGRALNTAHSKGILHRDLKPENIMIQMLSDGEEQVKIIDFGIARVQDSQIATTTQTTAVVGTIAYMSPEQLTAQPLGVTSEVYSLAIIAYEMITGRRPFNPASIFQLYQLQQDEVKVPPIDLRPSLPDAAQDAILKALSFEPEARYQSAREFTTALADALKGIFDAGLQSQPAGKATRVQASAAKTANPPLQAAVSPKGAAPAPSRAAPKPFLTAKVLVPALLVFVVAVAGVVVYRRFTTGAAPPVAPPKITTVEFNDEFLNLERWNVPPTGWNVNSRDGLGRLEIENQVIVGSPKGITYDNFEVSFNLKLLNDAGAAWALRVKDPDNYYLFYLSGPGGNFQNRFVAYIVTGGKFVPASFYSSIPFPVDLKSGEQYQIDIKAEGNQITHKITPVETGEEMKLGLFNDPENTFPYGSIGFRTVGVEKFSVDDLYIRPLGTKQPQ